MASQTSVCIAINSSSYVILENDIKKQFDQINNTWQKWDIGRLTNRDKVQISSGVDCTQ